MPRSRNVLRRFVQWFLLFWLTSIVQEEKHRLQESVAMSQHVLFGQLGT